ncbi:MAG: hypothetical protein NVSMB54_00280 [Ktedonobacteraceae bacterium]
MNPTLVTILGLLVAVLIILWAVVELTQRYTRHKKADSQARNAWVMVKPTTIKIVDDVSHDEVSERTTDSDLHKRAKQNGHYSHCKPIK